MRILVVHNRYQKPGGEQTAVDAEVRMLQANGCSVDLFDDTNERIAELGAWRAGLQATWSTAAARRLAETLGARRYDVVHVHNFFPLLSPSIHHTAHRLGLPVVQTLHNHRLFCVSPTPYRQGAPCQDCLGRQVSWPGIVHGCYRGSRAASGAVAMMQTVHRMLGTWRTKVARFIVASAFARGKCLEAGLRPDKVVVKPHVLFPSPEPGRRSGRHLTFVGRLTEAKGVKTLLSAWRLLGRSDVTLKIVGDGALAPKVAAAVRSTPSIEWLRWQSPAEVRALIGEARFVVVPAESFETFSMVVVEAYALGVPVVGTDFGAVGELILDDRTGLQHRFGDASDLASKIGDLLGDEPRQARFAARARAEFEDRFTERQIYPRLMEIYEASIAERQSHP